MISEVSEQIYVKKLFLFPPFLCIFRTQICVSSHMCNHVTPKCSSNCIGSMKFGYDIYLYNTARTRIRNREVQNSTPIGYDQAKKIERGSVNCSKTLNTIPCSRTFVPKTAYMYIIFLSVPTARFTSIFTCEG